MTWRNTPPDGRKFAQCLVVPIQEYIVLQWDPALGLWCGDDERFREDDVLWTPLPRPPLPMAQWASIGPKTHELEPLD